MVNEKYFQGGKDAKYLKGGKEISDAAAGLVGEFNKVEKNAYTKDGTELNKNATLPIDVMNIVYDFFVEKVMGLGTIFWDLTTRLS